MLQALQAYMKQLEHERLVSDNKAIDQKIAQVQKQIVALNEDSALEEDKGKWIILT